MSNRNRVDWLDENAVPVTLLAPIDRINRDGSVAFTITSDHVVWAVKNDDGTFNLMEDEESPLKAGAVEGVDFKMGHKDIP